MEPHEKRPKHEFVREYLSRPEINLSGLMKVTGVHRLTLRNVRNGGNMESKTLNKLLPYVRQAMIFSAEYRLVKFRVLPKDAEFFALNRFYLARIRHGGLQVIDPFPTGLYTASMFDMILYRDEQGRLNVEDTSGKYRQLTLDEID